jgi:hypothetical protein
MGKHQHLFSRFAEKDYHTEDANNTELVPTRDEVDQSRRLVEEVRRAVETRDKDEQPEGKDR